MTVGERIKDLCQQEGISIKKLEEDLGYGNGSLATSTEKIQAGRAIAIAKYFNVSLNYILTGEDTPTAFQQGKADRALLRKIHSLNNANYQVVISMIDTMLANQEPK